MVPYFPDSVRERERKKVREREKERERVRVRVKEWEREFGREEERGEEGRERNRTGLVERLKETEFIFVDDAILIRVEVIKQLHDQ